MNEKYVNRIKILKNHIFVENNEESVIVYENKTKQKDEIKENSKITKYIFNLFFSKKVSNLLNHFDDTTKSGKEKTRASIFDKVIRTFQGSGPLSTESIQAFNNILFLVNSIPPRFFFYFTKNSLNSLSIFNIMLRSSPKSSELLPFLAQVKIPKNALGGTDYKTFITTLR
jgi:hypothetical protein